MEVDKSELTELHKFVSDWMSLRRWERTSVPFASPQIALDVVLYAVAMRLEGREIPAKSAHLSVGHSADRVREIVSMLVAEGWLCRKPHPADGRIRLIEATDQLIGFMLKYKKGAIENLSRSAIQRESHSLQIPGTSLDSAVV